MVSPAAMSDPTSWPRSGLKYGPVHASGASTTPSTETISPATIFRLTSPSKTPVATSAGRFYWCFERAMPCWTRRRDFSPAFYRAALQACSAPDGADRVGVLAHGLGAVLARLAAEPAVHGHAEVGDVARRRRDPPAQPGNPVDRQHDAEEHPCVARLKVNERPEE